MQGLRYLSYACAIMYFCTSPRCTTWFYQCSMAHILSVSFCHSKSKMAWLHHQVLRNTFLPLTPFGTKSALLRSALTSRMGGPGRPTDRPESQRLTRPKPKAKGSQQRTFYYSGTSLTCSYLLRLENVRERSSRPN